MELNKRIDWLDISKAVAVYLVLLGHIVEFCSPIFRVIFSFHMPAFIIFSGYTLKVDNVSFRDFLIKKFRALMIPFFGFNISGIVLSEIFPCTHVSRVPIKSLPFKNLLTGGAVYGHVGAIWFLNALFWGSIISFILIKVYKSNKTIGIVLFWLQFIGACFIRTIMSLMKIPASFPFRLDSSMMFAVFLIIGYFFRNSDFFYKQLSLSACILIIFISSSLCLLSGCIYNGYVNICDCCYGDRINYIIAAISGTIAIIHIAKLIECIPYLSTLLRNIGKNTLFIFAFQAYSYQQLNYLFNKFFSTNFVVGTVSNKFILYSLFLSLFSLLLLYAIKRCFDFVRARIGEFRKIVLE